MTQMNAISETSRADLGWRPDLRSPLVIALLGLVGLQLLLALGLSLRGPGVSALSARTPLLDFDPDQVVQIQIEGAADGAAVTLRRGGEDEPWVLPNLGDFPVATFKVEQLLERLAELERPLPTATSEEARKRFKVADDGFERRLTLEDSDDEVASLLLGDSSGFRRVFARPAREPAVYDLSLSLFDLSNRREDWIDTGLLRLEQEEIESIAGTDWTLNKGPEGWHLEGKEAKVDQSAAEEAARRLANLSYRGVLGTEEDPSYNQQEPRLVLDIRLADGTSRDYRISQQEDSEDYVLKDAARPHYFKLSKYDLDDLLELGPDTLTLEPEPTEDAPQEPAPTSAATGGVASEPAE